MGPSTALTLIRKFEARSCLKLPNLEELDALLQLMEVRARDCAFSQGDLSPYVYVVRSGLFKQQYTKRTTPSGLKASLARVICLRVLVQLATKSLPHFHA